VEEAFGVLIKPAAGKSASIEAAAVLIAFSGVEVARTLLIACVKISW
jgi:hypothetical protein